MTPHAIPGRNPVAEAIRAGRTLSEVVADERGGDDIDRLVQAARAAGVPTRRAPRSVLDEVSAGVVHQGIVARAPAFAYRSLDDLTGTDLLVVLDGVTDPQNLGAVARSAEAAGAGGLVLRERRSVHVTPAAEKASAGALSWLPVALVPNVTRAVETLAQAGFWSAGLAGEGGESLWTSPLLDGRVVLVVGAEGAGLSRLVAERVDGLVSVPMQGHAESLNAGIAAAVALFEVCRRRAIRT